MVKFLQTVALLVLLGLTHAQEALYAQPVELWGNQIIPSIDGIEPGVLKGNGCKLTPDKSSLIVTSVGGTVSAFSAIDGTFEWEYNPPQPAGGIVRSHSHVAFTTVNATVPPYMVYSVVENENSAEAVARVIALDMIGNELWVSGALPGVPAGSPVVSDDGLYIFLTHNANFETIGYFTALEADDGAPFYSRSNDTTPFAPPGIYHHPVEGNYDGDEGRDNTNDMIMWTMSPKPTDTVIGTGHTFGFQFPLGFDGNASDVGYFLLGDSPRNFQGITAPTLTNYGLNAYFSTTRSGFYGWTGVYGLGRGRFNRGPQGVAGFERNAANPGQAVYASPAVSSSQESPIIFCGTASTQFVRMNADFSEELTVETNSTIKAEARVDPFDRAVYFVEESGVVHQVDFDTLADIWTFDLGFPVEGEMALNPKGYILYIADTSGFVKALQLSDIPVTPSPTAAPSTAGTPAPTVGTPAPVVTTDSPTASVTPDTTEGNPAPGAPDTPTESPVEGGMPAPEPTPEAAGASQPMLLFSMASLLLALLV